MILTVEIQTHDNAADHPAAAQAAPLVSNRTALIVMAAFSLMQGLPAFFFTLGLPAILRDRGASLDMVAMTYVVWIPLALKWLWAPVFDSTWFRPFGSRQNWLRGLSILLALAFSAVALFPPEGSAWPLLALSLLCSGLGATIQIVLAAWMIENAPPQQRAIANTAGVIAMVLGGILGAGLMLELDARFSWTISVLSVSSLIVALSLPAWFLNWGAAKRADARSGGFRFEPVALWKRFFRRPNIGWMMFAILCFGATAGADALVPAILVDKGYSPAAAGWLLGTVATATVIPASAVVGAALRRFSVLGVAAAVYAVKAVVLMALAAAVSLAPHIVAGLSILDFCLSGALTVVIWQLYMNFSSREHSASDYSVTTSFDAAIRFAGALAAGAIGQRLGYPVVFGLAGLAAILSCILCLPLRRTLQTDVQPLGQEA